jgi:hypothetical protein
MYNQQFIDMSSSSSSESDLTLSGHCPRSKECGWLPLNCPRCSPLLNWSSDGDNVCVAKYLVGTRNGLNADKLPCVLWVSDKMSVMKKDLLGGLE